MFYPKSKEKSLSKELFLSPTSEYRGAPFWAWNCKLDKETLEKQIDNFKTMGMGGFHMHVRTGMATPYLTDEYMEFVKFCIDKAKADGMLAYLYDEDRWPSGSCGGKVTAEHPEFAMKNLMFTPVPYGKAKYPLPENDTGRARTRTENGHLLAVYDVTLGRDGSLSSYRRIAENEVVDAKGDVWYAYSEAAVDSPWFNDHPYVDTLNPEAIKEFIKTTHEKYYSLFGKDFGTNIPSIFTDEPQFAFKGVLPFAEGKTDVFMPWTDGMDEKYRKSKGYSLLDKYPEVIWELPDGQVSRVRYDYHDFISELFASAYCDTLGNWCDAHNIALGGHLMLEDNLQSQTKAVGESMRCYRAFKRMPGMDLLCNRREFNTAIQCRSVKRQQGSEAILSELYGVTGWDFDFRGHKLQGDWQAALGVTLRVPHLTWMSMKGEAKRDYPACIGYQSPWWKEYSLIEDHFARVNTALTRGSEDIRLAIIHPIESYWLCWGPSSQTEAVRTAMEKQHRLLTEYLITGMQNFDFISEALLPSFCEKGGAPLEVGLAKYDTVIVPGCKTLRKTTLDRLETFKAQGGKLIFIGDAPLYEDALPSDRPKKLYDASVRIPFDRSSVLDAVEELRFVDVRIEKNEGGEAFAGLAPGMRTEDKICQIRDDGDAKWFFLCPAFDPKCKDVDPDLTFKISFKGEWSLELYDTLSGEIKKLGAEYRDGDTVLHKKLFMHDSLLLRLTPGRSEAAEQKDVVLRYTGRRIDERVDITLSEPNALLLDMARFCFDGGEWRGTEEFLRLDNVCRKEIGIPLRKKHITQPYCVKPTEPKHKVHLSMDIPSEIECSGVHLALEDADKTEIIFNGEKVESKVDGWYVDEAITTVRLPDVRKGVNTLELICPIGERTSLEWCYLLGDFGVRVDGTIKTLIPPVRKLAFGDFTHQGLPFYTGNVTYSFDAEADETGKLSIRTEQYRGALIEVSVDGKREGLITFSPYLFVKEGLDNGKHRVDLKLYGTRQNGFAQLHHTQGIYFYQSPDSWRSKDALWTYEYQFKQAGILKSPTIN